MGNRKIVVVGASNMDLISYVPRLPTVGETLHGNDFQMGYGGKGANQAVMAARLGANVSLLAKIGDDMFGRDMIKNLKSNGVNTTHVHVTGESSSGVAPIAVEPGGRNSIIIITGANDLLNKTEVEQARGNIVAADIVVGQLEIPLEITLDVFRIARNANVITILNPAPAKKDLAGEILKLSDLVCPNETEAELLTGISVDSITGAENAAKALVSMGAHSVLITLGAQGCFLLDENGSEYFPSEDVNAIDTTGAGDAFVGSLAYFLSAGKQLRDSIPRANQIAAMTVQRKGTQASFPAASELPATLLA